MVGKIDYTILNVAKASGIRLLSFLMSADERILDLELKYEFIYLFRLS